MRLATIFFLGFVAMIGPASAQVQPDDATNRLVHDTSEALFDLLPKQDFAAERAFMTDELAAMANLTDWTRLRRQVIADAGSTPRYTAHAVTFYRRTPLLAAVDFWGKAAKADTFVCGFAIWEIPSPGVIGLGRIEQNVVPVAVMRKMDLQQAAQVLADWRCPKDLIGSVLGVKVQ